MFKRLLLALDGTTEAAAAVPAAEALARATGAAITILYVWGTKEGSPAEALMGDLIATDEVRAIADGLAASGAVVDSMVEPGPVAASIIKAAISKDVDVIVMATHGRTGLARAFAGSVSERVVADSGRLVLLLKPGDRELKRVQTLLVPVDGTAGGALALGTAVGLARTSHGRLVLVNVVAPAPRWMYSGASAAGAHIDPAWENDALHSAVTYVERFAGRLRKGGLEVETRAMIGQVADTTRAVSEETDADLIVMSTHALTGPERTVLGSVADAVVRTSSRPVLLAHRPRGALDEAHDEVRPASEPSDSNVAAT